MSKWKVPVHKETGSIPDYVYDHAKEEYVWMEPFEFDAVLVFDGYSRGRSAANFQATNKATGAQYNLSMKGMSKVLEMLAVTKGEMKGRWRTVKQGQSYFIEPVV